MEAGGEACAGGEHTEQEDVSDAGVGFYFGSKTED